MTTSRNIIKFVLLFIVVSVVFISIYYVIKYKESPNVEAEKTYDVYVSAIDFLTKEQIAVNFSVISNNTKIFSGITNARGLEVIKISEKDKILNFFIRDENYYAIKNVLIGSEIKLDAHRIGNLKAFHSGKLNSTNRNITIFLDTDYLNLQLASCIDYSNNIKDVKILNKEESIILDTFEKCEGYNKNWIEETSECTFGCKLGFKNANITSAHCEVSSLDELPPTFLNNKNIKKCYYLESVKNDTQLKFDLLYDAYESLDVDDYIRLYIIDSDNSDLGVYKFEDENGKDWAAKTLEYEISYSA